MNFLKKIGLEPFIIMLFGSILLAYIYPPIGIEREGGVSLGEIANWGVSFIFFFYGMRLNRDKLKAGLSIRRATDITCGLAHFSSQRYRPRCRRRWLWCR